MHYSFNIKDASYLGFNKKIHVATNSNICTLFYKDQANMVSWIVMIGGYVIHMATRRMPLNFDLMKHLETTYFFFG